LRQGSGRLCGSSDGDRLAVRAGFGVAVALTMAAVVLIYRVAARSYFVNDDFEWLQHAQRFNPVNLLQIERYVHFYRPVIEVYFAVAYRVFGCDPYPFHLTSIGIHLIIALVVFLFARALSGRPAFGLLTAVLFVVHPSYADAVSWVGAITDMLPALWYVLALLLHLRYLQTEDRRFYFGTLAVFVLCLLTHETSATLLVTMVLLEWMVDAERGRTASLQTWVRRIPAYLPFAIALAAYLAITYVVNSRSYLVTGGHYRLGCHIIPNVLNYVIWLYVGKRGLSAYVAITAVAGVLLIRGTPRVRFCVLWGALTLMPPSLFTWENVGRYLYLPGVPFALLLAEGLLAFERLLAKRLPSRVAMATIVFLAVAIAARFTVFATKAGANFRERTRPYERFAAALRAANPMPRPGDVITVGPDAVEGFAASYRDPAAQVVFCTPDLHVEVR
jgi:hypothetical protein